MTDKKIHIISFDVPYPPNYGGIIDVFNRIKSLKKNEIDVVLHCFDYGRGKKEILEEYCKGVYYYPRKTGIIEQISLTPYIVKSRRSDQLLNRLLEDNSPILFEGTHCCYYLHHPKLKDRLKIVRMHNIEHDYYFELSKSEKSFVQKIFLNMEGYKLKRYEKILNFADVVLSVSENDVKYLKSQYPNVKTVYLPSFNNFGEVQCVEGKGNYALYQGNLSIAENHEAAISLIDTVFSKLSYPFIIAGMNPKTELIQKIQKYPNISLVENPDEPEMQNLLKNAQVNIMITSQPTGLKLKLVNALFAGRFCIVNRNMLAGTHLEPFCIIAETSEQIIAGINKIKDRLFNKNLVEERRGGLKFIYNTTLVSQFIQLVWDKNDKLS